MDLGGGEEDQLPQRTEWGEQRRVENCQRLLPALMQGLERAEGAVRPSWSRFSTCHSSGHRLKPRTALSGWGPTANSAAPMLTLMRWLGSIGRAASHRRRLARCDVEKAHSWSASPCPRKQASEREAFLSKVFRQHPAGYKAERKNPHRKHKTGKKKKFFGDKDMIHVVWYSSHKTCLLSFAF